MHTFATIVASNQTLAQRYFPGYFGYGASATGLAPATHWVTTGAFDNDELEKLANKQPWVAGIGFGYDPAPVLKKLGIIPIAPIAAEADPVTPAVPVPPAAVTMRQARLALLGAGKLAAVDAAINSMTEPTRSAARIEWEYSGEVQRHNGFVSALGPALGLTADQIDALFVAAAKL